MMNPDGVFIGNYRMGIMGADFNRKFDSQKDKPILFPEVNFLKTLIKNLNK